MNKLNFEAINMALDAETLVPQWLPGGQRRGREWVAANPNRADKNAGSFSVNLETGRWKDFADHGTSGKDLVSLYAYLFHNDDQGAAARELAQSHGITVDAEAIQKAAEKVTNIEAAKPRLVMPVPADAPQEPDEQWNTGFRHPEFGKPSRVWPYRDAKGRLLLYVARYDVEPRKQVLPWSYVFDPAKNRHRWTIRGITGKDKRPLYGLDRLAANPDADAILVEGEKTADAAQELMGDTCVAVAWLGGVESADKVSVKALEGRRVILWPDFDAQRDKATGNLMPMHEQPGIRAMMALAQQLKGVAREVLLVGYDIDPENAGWDLADGLQEGWTGERVMAYMGKRAGDPQHIASGKTSKPAAAPTPANDNEPNVPLDASVNPFGYVHLSDKGQPMNTVENLEYMLGEYGITARYNVIKKDVDVTIPGRDYGQDSASNMVLAEVGSICARNRMPKSDLDSYIKLLGIRNRFNPAEEMIRARDWDGKTRLPQLYATLETAPKFDRALMELMLRKWLISAVAAVLHPNGFWSKGVLVLQGDQSLGKTAWIKALLPQEQRGLIKIGAIIDPSNKDTISSAIGHWIVELGELDGTFRKADIARLKAFISQDIDQLRRPYDRLESSYQRRTVFCASVNPEKFLADETGNVRWWTIPILSLVVEHGIDVQQLWAEVAHLYESGERWWLEREEEALLEAANREHEATDPVEEQILSAFNWDDPKAIGGKEMTATDVLLAIGYDKPTRQAATHASTILKKLAGEPKRKNSGRYFQMPQYRGKPRRSDDQDTQAF
jgi:putative DNA primase/helicase